LRLMAGKPLKRACAGGATLQVDRITEDTGTMPSLALSPAKAKLLVVELVPAGR
jgi:hypothetical protein